jgi:hypothetical protein
MQLIPIVVHYDPHSPASEVVMIDRRIIFEFFPGEEPVFGDGNIGIARFLGLAPEHDQQ